MARSTRDVITAPEEGFAHLLDEGMGGVHSYARLLGLRTFDALELCKRIEAGFSFRAFERFAQVSGLTLEALAALVRITPRTLARRRHEGTLAAEESDRLLRAARVFARALALFEGDVEGARRWLAEPATALGGHTPLAMTVTEVGASEVEALIGRLEHGVFT